MPNLKLTNLASYKAYFADVAVKHKQIDGFKWGDQQVINNDNRSDMPARWLWAQPYETFRYTGQQSDNINKVKPAKVAYFIVADSGLFADIESAYDFCEAVIEDIFSKILKDKKGMEVDGAWSMLATNINSWKGNPVQHVIPGSTKYIGCEMEFEFMDNTNLAYDPDKWNS